MDIEITINGRPIGATARKLLGDVLQSGLESVCEDLGWPDDQDGGDLHAVIAITEACGGTVPSEATGEFGA